MSSNKDPDQLWTTDEVRELFGYTNGYGVIRHLRRHGVTHVSRRGVNGQLEWNPDDVRAVLRQAPQGQERPDAEVQVGSIVRIRRGSLLWEVEEIDGDEVLLRAAQELKRGRPAQRVTDINALRVVQ